MLLLQHFGHDVGEVVVNLLVPHLQMSRIVYHIASHVAQELVL